MPMFVDWLHVSGMAVTHSASHAATSHQQKNPD